MAVDLQSWIGTTLADGRFEIEALLGQGGMGSVFRARQVNLDSPVVIKVPHPTLMTDSTVSKRFLHEVRSLVKLRHPHVVAITDVGEHNGLPFLVMAYLSGGSLEDRRPKTPDGTPQPVPPPQLRDWLPVIAGALDFIHSQDYVHRDVKPENILFDEHQHVFLSDFGIAKAVGDQSGSMTDLTGTGFIGTPGYIAPEILLGKEYDRRVDQYALAATVYELLAGRPPFDGPTAVAIMAKQVTDPAPQLRDVCPSVSEAISNAVMRGLERAPEDRYNDCRAFAAALDDAMARGDTTAQPSPSQKTERVTETGPQVPLPESEAVTHPQPPSNETVVERSASPNNVPATVPPPLPSPFGKPPREPERPQPVESDRTIPIFLHKDGEVIAIGKPPREPERPQPVESDRTIQEGKETVRPTPPPETRPLVKKTAFNWFRKFSWSDPITYIAFLFGAVVIVLVIALLASLGSREEKSDEDKFKYDSGNGGYWNNGEKKIGPNGKEPDGKTYDFPNGEKKPLEYE